MRVGSSKDWVGQIFFWVAIALAPLSLLMGAHRDLQRFVMGMAVGILLAALGRFAWCGFRSRG
jgi:hypothetical protein